MTLQRRRKLYVLVLLSTLLAAFFTLGLIVPPTPAIAIPPSNLCSTLPQEGDTVTDDDGIKWVCVCAQPVPEWNPVCGWVKEEDLIRRAKHAYFPNMATNSLSLVDASIERHVGGAGNFGQTDLQIFGSGGNRISRPLGARVIVAEWTGSAWQACHDSNWQYTSGDATHMAVRRAANCGSGYYRTQSIGKYFSRSLNTWLTSSWVITGSLCIPAGGCGVAPPPD